MATDVTPKCNWAEDPCTLTCLGSAKATMNNDASTSSYSFFGTGFGEYQVSSSPSTPLKFLHLIFLLCELNRLYEGAQARLISSFNFHYQSLYAFATMSGGPTRTLLPIIPLARNSVLLPGVTLRIPVSNRPDIPALLSAVYTKAAKPNADAPSVQVGCVPMCSPLLSHEGQQLLEDSELRTRRTIERLAEDPGRIQDEGDLFGYGCIAKISGVQGRRPGELALVVEGVRRFRVERFTQFKPYLECEITPLGEESK